MTKSLLPCNSLSLGNLQPATTNKVVMFDDIKEIKKDCDQ
jgi:hypothetical protein